MEVFALQSQTALYTERVGTTVTIHRRFRGPLDSANGGYAAGLLGPRIGGPAEVTLRLPPPLERPLAIRRDHGRLLLEDGVRLVAEAASAPTAAA